MPLERELGLRDLTLFAIACIIGTRWIASAAHAGSGSILLWFLGAIFFVIPLAISIAALTIKHPEAGGLYRWTRADFGPFHGFLAFWLYWMGIAIWFPSAAIFYVSIVVSPDNRALLIGTALAAIWIALGTNLLGVKIGKWTENFGATAAWLLGILLVVMAVLVWRRRGSATQFHLLPTFSWDTVSFWSTIAYAMSGLELAGLMGGEIRDPARNFPRAAWIASIFTTVFYAGTTMALLIVLPAGGISELNGLTQAGSAAGQVLGAGWFAPVIAALVLATAVGQFGGFGASVSRMPFAAGADKLLPRAFARIHPRFHTPHISILTLGAIATVLLIAIQAGDTLRGAYQTLVSLMVVAGFLPYLYIFGSAWKAGKHWSAISGSAVTVLAILCSIVPTAEIQNVWLFEAKLAGGTLAVIASGWIVYRRFRSTI